MKELPKSEWRLPLPADVEDAKQRSAAEKPLNPGKSARWTWRYKIGRYEIRWI